MGRKKKLSVKPITIKAQKAPSLNLTGKIKALKTKVPKIK